MLLFYSRFNGLYPNLPVGCQPRRFVIKYGLYGSDRSRSNAIAQPGIGDDISLVCHKLLLCAQLAHFRQLRSFRFYKIQSGSSVNQRRVTSRPSVLYD
jgi:hypothetical protein